MSNRIGIGWTLIFLAMIALNAEAGDPTRPAYLTNSRPLPKYRKPAPLVPLTLSAIYFSDHRRLAIINNQFMRVGERIEGATITEISRSAVTVVRRGKTSMLRIRGVEAVKTTSQPLSEGVGAP